MQLSDNAAILFDNVEKACASVGRKASEITVVAATKCVAADVVYTLPKLGITIAGENKVQEFTQKYRDGSPLCWHIIGALQTNKVKYVIGKAAMIQSVDRISLAREISRLSGVRGVVTEVLAEVNIGGEKSKSGIPPEELDEFYAEMLSVPNIRPRGIMCVPPIGSDAKIYDRMRKLYDSLGGKYDGVDTLSMGMSDDYQTAIRGGANMIRIGRALFGPRQSV